MRPAPDVLMGGRYRLTRQIAVGGMGEVWAAHDTSLQRDIAIKVLREEFAGDTGFLERFRTEARNAGSLSHEGIAALFDYGEQDGSAFLAMELIVGEPMSDLLEREPVLPPRRLLPILAQTARALHAAHLAGVVHRDVKPGNILITPTGKVKITDFGVSLSADQVPMTATGMVMGTAQYLSPEQAVGGPATAASDMYALGIVAYEALVGHRPFTGPTAVDIAVAHVNTPVPPLPSTVSRPIAQLVMRLLAKDPASRPDNADELADMFDALVPHTPARGAAPVSIVPGRAANRRGDVPAARGGTTDRPATAAATSGGRPSEAGAMRVRGSSTSTASAPVSAPPSFDPRTGRPTDGSHAPTYRAPGARGQHSQPTTRAHARVQTAGGGSRFHVRWPLLVLAVLVVALLGAALADQLTRADGGGAGGAPLTTLTSTHADPAGGMISPHVPDAAATDARTTTAKDA
ncbi:serine/threonine protein kinase [Cellulomonas triticagri]|uniref:non-specific serine/threonine protein kinase n=1 Tax=Cellulomonas triticagri TaxID=2483352 RepID=A0A3M2JQ07_9CELL|nr:serine/threonine protein kinase [Cellulomonas triticagri]RMI14451.1 serine/threonine protein kinase [Cellulomonas triticagri]